MLFLCAQNINLSLYFDWFLRNNLKLCTKILSIVHVFLEWENEVVHTKQSWIVSLHRSKQECFRKWIALHIDFQHLTWWSPLWLGMCSVLTRTDRWTKGKVKQTSLVSEQEGAIQVTLYHHCSIHGQVVANANLTQHARNYIPSDLVLACGIYKTVFRHVQLAGHGLYALQSSYEWNQSISRLQCFIIVSKFELFCWYVFSFSWFKTMVFKGSYHHTTL